MQRRTFLGTMVSAAGAAQRGGALPWYRRAYRWGQTNITEKDPDRYDIEWWRQYWKRTEVQGVIINAGGIVAYYPSKFPLHHRAEFLRDRDLYGELVKAAHADELAVLARMDSNRTAEDFYRAHPDWFARDIHGNPYRAVEKYVTCIHGPYYEEYLPSVLREIVERSRPEGFTDNSWSGLGRDSICYCDNCTRKFQAASGMALPRKADWDDRAYRQWIPWNYRRRLDIWDLNNRATKAAGGPDCLWIGMNSGSITGQSRSFRDIKEICGRAEMILLDHQRRDDSSGFQQNGECGKLIHGLLGWDKIAPESMAMYNNGRNSFRLASKPAAEARMWMLEGFAGGIQPWWHHISAYHEDRRMYKTAEPVMRWHRANEQYLVNRVPVAPAGLVWSQRNTDFYGRNDPDGRVDQPYRGFFQALVRARIPYIPVNADHIDREAPGLTLLILPNVGAMSLEQCAAVRRFVERGGSLIATGVTSLYDEWGDPRNDFALASLFGASATQEFAAAYAKTVASAEHTYLRLSPELRAKVPGPKAGDEPSAVGERHAVLGGFEETDILPFGGLLAKLRVANGAVVPLTFIPDFPVYPPETSWMRTPKTDIPALVLNVTAAGGRVAYMPADIDRRFTRDNQPDHFHLLANLVHWALKDTLPLRVKGPGRIDCHLYKQPGRLVLHLINLTNPEAWRSSMEELYPVGPLKIEVRLPAGVGGRKVQLLVGGGKLAATVRDGWAEFDVRSVVDHEVAVIS